MTDWMDEWTNKWTNKQANKKEWMNYELWYIMIWYFEGRGTCRPAKCVSIASFSAFKTSSWGLPFFL